MTKLEELGLTLGDLDLGGIDAESDYRLAEYFVQTPYVSHALQGRRNQFIGRKGSGKSALFLQLPDLARRRDPNLLVVKLTPDQYSWAALRDYSEQGLGSVHAHTNAWRFTLTLEAVGALVDLEQNWSREAKDAIRTLKKFLSDNFGTLRPGLTTTATKFIKGVTDFNLEAFGFAAGLSRSPYTAQPLTPALLDKLIELLGVVTKERGIILALDKLDDSWDGSTESHSLLIGLLKAAKYMNDTLGPRNEQSGLRVNVFIRTDIYSLLGFIEKDKHRPLEIELTWTEDLLRQMMNERLPAQLDIDDIFESGEMRGVKSAFSYIVKRTFLRPREVLQFVDEAQNQAGEDAVIITKEDVRTAEERYSQWKVEDLTQEFMGGFPDFGRLLECLRQQLHRYDSVDDLEALLRRQDPTLVDRYGARSLAEKLFDCSVIGIRPGDSGSTRFVADSPTLTLPRTGKVYVHQGLHKGLMIREARKPSELGARDGAPDDE